MMARLASTLIVSGVAVGACQPAATPTSLVPQFAGVCAYRVSVEKTVAIEQVARTLEKAEAKFCEWDKSKSDMLVVSATFADQCPDLAAALGGVATPIAFKDISHYEAACSLGGIQISQMSSFPFKDRLPSYQQKCFTWSTKPEVGVRTAFPIQTLGTVLYQDRALPIFASRALGDQLQLWIDEAKARSLSDLSDAQIAQSASTYGYILVQADCASDLESSSL